MIMRQSGESMGMPCSQYDQLRATSEPIVEIHRIGEEVKVITELPGTTMDAIDLELQGSSLTIDADGGPFQYHARADLPPVNPGSMHTSLKNGVLEITLHILPGVADEESSRDSSR
jgi:HSP20 family molecular chaperone IbpA